MYGNDKHSNELFCRILFRHITFLSLYFSSLSFCHCFLFRVTFKLLVTEIWRGLRKLKKEIAGFRSRKATVYPTFIRVGSKPGNHCFPLSKKISKRQTRIMYFRTTRRCCRWPRRGTLKGYRLWGTRTLRLLRPGITPVATALLETTPCRPGG